MTFRRVFRFRPDDPADAVGEELRFHFASRIEALIQAGATPAQARAQALEEFGDVDATRRQLEEIDRRVAAREAERERVTAFGLEVRLAARRLIRHPGFSVPAFATLALGLATAATLFVLLHAVVLRALPWPKSERLVRLRSSVPGVGGATWGLAKAEFLYFTRETKNFDHLGLYLYDRAPVAVGTGLAADVGVAIASPGVARALGARAALGRLLGEADGLGQTAPVAVITHGFWRDYFGGDPRIIGRSVRLNGFPYEIVGVFETGTVLPEELEAPGEVRVDFWLPLPLDPAEPPQNSHVFRAIGRLAPGAARTTAAAELDHLTARLPDVLPQAYSPAFMTRTGFGTVVTPLRTDILGGIDRVLWILFGAGLLVLAVAGANTTNLFVARFEARRPELAVRAALGAGRIGLVRHLLVEAVLLGLVAGACALALAFLGVRLFTVMTPAGLPRVADARIGWLAVLFTVGAAVMLSAVVALLPLARRRDVVSLFSDATRGTPGPARHRARRALVAVQMALSLVLLAGAGLLVRSFRQLLSIEPGFEPRNVVTFTVTLPRARYGDPAASARFYHELEARIAALPGVRAAGLATTLPLSGFDGCSGLEPEGLGPENKAQLPCVPIVLASPGYLRALGVPLRGEPPTRAASGRANLVVSESFIRRYWPGQDPMGKAISQSRTIDPERVVGVAGDVRLQTLEQEPLPTVYFPIEPTTQYSQYLPLAMRAVVRVERGTPATWAAPLRAAVASLDADVVVLELQTLEQSVARSLARRTGAMVLLLSAALVASLLAMLGMYAVVSYLVAERRRELGIRLALGARTDDLGRLVLSQAARVVLLGLGAGIVSALGLTRLLGSQLFGVAPTDPWALGAAALILVVLATLATWIPARRATRVDPIEVLRN